MKVLVVARREVRSAFNSPVAYIVAVAYLAFTASWLFFINQFFAQDDASLSLYFNVVPVVLARRTNGFSKSRAMSSAARAENVNDGSFTR